MAAVTAVADVPTASVQVTVSGSQLLDTFTRVTANGWGTADSGQAWTVVSGAAGDFSTNGTRGLMQHSAVNSIHRVVINGPMADVDARITVFPTVVATGAAIEMNMPIRRAEGANSDYRPTLAFNPGGTVDLILTKTVVGVTTTLATVSAFATYIAGSSFILRARAVGTTIQVKAWGTAVTEPTAWGITVVDNSITAGGAAAARSVLRTGNTNTLPVTVQFDNFLACFTYDTLLRVYPDGTTSVVRGSPFVLSDCTAVLYDTEAPLNTSIFYRATTTGGSDVTDSNSVTIESGDDGWLKDPLHPTSDLKLDNCAVHSPQCISTDANVFFQYLDTESYASASGVFGVVDSARPITVAQTRKDQQSTLGIVSRKLSDIIRIRTLLSPGSPLFLQLPSRYGWGITTWASDYLQVYDDSANRLGRDMGKPYRAWTMPFTASRIPADVNNGLTGGGVLAPLGFTYGDSTATGRTYAQSTALGRTYLVRTQHPTF